MSFKVEDKLLLDINNILNGRAHICGGALRSYFEDREAKDIDIFMLTDSLSAYDDICEELLYKFGNKSFTEVEDTLMEGRNYCSFDFKHYASNTTISIIKPQVLYGRECYGSIEKIVREIDINVCRIGLKRDNSLYCPEGILNVITDINSRCMRIISQRGEEEADRTFRRISKYKEYGYRLIPSEVYKGEK